MADQNIETPPPPQTEDLPLPVAEDVSRWFAATGVNGTCPLCGNTTWTIVSEGDRVATAQTAVGKTGSVLPFYLRLLAVICTRCAFVRQHAYNSFQQWLSKNPR
jgi:hypothetical protein